MKILYAKALVKDLEAVSRNPGVKKRLLKIIEILKAIDTLDELHHLKKIEGYDCYYRLRIGDYRFPARYDREIRSAFMAGKGAVLVSRILNEVSSLMKPLAKGIRLAFKQDEKELTAFSHFIQDK